MSKKVLHIITSTNVGGAESMLYKYLVNSDRSLLNHHVISLSELGNIGLKIRSTGIPVYALSSPIYSVRGLKELHSVFKSIAPNIIQSWLYHSDFISLLLKTFNPNVILCWNIRSYKVCRYKSSTCFLVRLLALFSRIPNVVIINSIASQEHHKKIGYKPKRWEYIPNGFDTNLFKQKQDLSCNLKRELGMHADVLLIGMVARFSSEKDHKTFLHACFLINNIFPDVYYILIGMNVDSSNTDLSNIISELHLNSRVHLLGERDDVHTIMSCFDITCSSSIDEAFPNVVGEAMSSEVPCVVTNVGDSALLVGDTGVVVESKSPKKIADACIELLKKPEYIRRQIGSKARQRIIDNFSIDQISSRYDQVYTEL